MKKYLVKAYCDNERGLKTQEKIITAENDAEAHIVAYKMFPEYKEVGVWEEEND